MNVRKNIYRLTARELSELQEALNGLKADGEYDDFTRRRHHAMMEATLLPGESGGANLRNAAHRGPAFLPWHRYFLRELEVLLQVRKPGMMLPYWDWAAEADDPFGAPLWNTDPGEGLIYMGGDGTGPGGVVTTGPFAHWTSLIADPSGGFVPRAGIVREFARVGLGTPIFPTARQVLDVVAGMPPYDYDTPPWHLESVDSFRNRMEGWLAAGGEKGPQLHNRVHVWIGGDMGPGTAPNDPVFFLHHCNIDRLWAQWQRAHPNLPYVPVTGGPEGHNLHDVMKHLLFPDATPAGALDYQYAFGYVYDTDPPS